MKQETKTISTLNTVFRTLSDFINAEELLKARK